MSDETRCDVCSCSGRRRHFRAAPDGWLFREVVDDETGAVYIVVVCSAACAAKFWIAGPGDIRG